MCNEIIALFHDNFMKYSNKLRKNAEFLNFT